MDEKAFGLLGISRKGGNIALGEDPVGQAAREGRARLIILASDAADHTVRRANSFAALHKTPLVQVDRDKGSLGQVFGRNSVAMIAMTEIKLAQRFLELLGNPERYGQALEAVRSKAEEMARRKGRKNGMR